MTQEEINRYIAAKETYPYSFRWEKSIRKNYPLLSLYIDSIKETEQIAKNMSFKQILWHILHHDLLFNLGKCQGCEKRAIYRQGKYLPYCSFECSCKSDTARKHMREIITSSEVKEKTKKTCRERYGVDNPFQSKGFKEKARKTCQERYGVDNPSQSTEAKDKSKQTCRERYGTPYASQTEWFKEKCKQTCIEKYGKQYASQNNEFKDRRKKTCMERYGAVTNLQTEDTKEKIRQTCIERYGGINPSCSAEVRQKAQRTMMNKFGVPHAAQNKDVAMKALRTCLERYGVNSPMQTTEIQNKMAQTMASRYRSNEDIADMSCIDASTAWSIMMSSPEVQQKINDTKRKNNSFNTSSIENKVAEYLTNNDVKFIRQYKSKEYPYNCDFYLIDYQLYIEINASWTHGKRPYIETDIDCIEILKLWTEKAESSKYYRNAIEVWTVRDVRKRETAKTNGLNYLEVFSNDIEEIVTYIDNAIHI